MTKPRAPRRVCLTYSSKTTVPSMLASPLPFFGPDWIGHPRELSFSEMSDPFTDDPMGIVLAQFGIDAALFVKTDSVNAFQVVLQPFNDFFAGLGL